MTVLQAQYCPTAAFQVQYSVCPDRTFESAAQAESPPHAVSQQHQNIPQVDGMEEAQHECCMFKKFFNTEDRGLLHFLDYEECDICYPWHVWS